MKTVTGLTTSVLCLMLGGCSEPTPAPAAPQPAASVESAAVPLTQENQGVLTDTQREGLNGADQVNDVLKQADEARRKQMEAQGL